LFFSEKEFFMSGVCGVFVVGRFESMLSHFVENPAT
jgi:hypothetical protein